MNYIVGLMIVFGGGATGYYMAHGPFAALWNAAEYMTILSMSFGALVAGCPFPMLKRFFGDLPKAFKGSGIKKDSYMELLGLLMTIFNVIRKEGVLGIEKDLSDPHSSERFQKYPGISDNHHAMDLLTGALRLFVDGVVNAFDLDKLMETEIDTHHGEASQTTTILNETGDALPGVGIVGAVMGIIITMQYIDGPPSEIGAHVGAALVGTLLGLFVAYGMVKPLSATISAINHEEHVLLNTIRAGIVSFAGGAPPQVALEFARKSIESSVRPSSEELDQIVQEARKG